MDICSQPSIYLIPNHMIMSRSRSDCASLGRRMPMLAYRLMFAPQQTQDRQGRMQRVCQATLSTASGRTTHATDRNGFAPIISFHLISISESPQSHHVVRPACMPTDACEDNKYVCDHVQLNSCFQTPPEAEGSGRDRRPHQPKPMRAMTQVFHSMGGNVWSFSIHPSTHERTRSPAPLGSKMIFQESDLPDSQVHPSDE
nr:hypothetical protein CFP56_52894 [Quercus suber]